MRPASSLLRRSSCVLLAVPIFLAARLASAQAPGDTVQTRHERIAGIVTTDSGAPIRGAEVIVTRGPDRAFRRDSTGADGRFSIEWEKGTGDYLVYVASPGRRSFRRRVQRTGPADTLFTVKAALAPEVAQLAAVKVQARRQKPVRDKPDAMSPPPGSASGQADMLSSSTSPEQRGDLAALAGTVPGVLATGGGFSALGLPSSQNQVSLDGLAFGGTDLPRAARVNSGVGTTFYDPARGGFSGAEQTVSLNSGGVFAFRNATLTLDAPQLQAVDRVGRATGQQYTNVVSSAGMRGPLGFSDRYFFSVAAQGSRRTADATSLFDAPSDVLGAAGVASDSVAALAAALGRMGIPLSAGLPLTSTTTRGSLITRFDWSPYDYARGVSQPVAGGITLYAAGRNSEPIGLSPASVATRAARSSGHDLAVQGSYSRYFGPADDRLIDFRIGYSQKQDEVSPALTLPGGNVLLPGRAMTGESNGGLTNVGFGGSGSSSRTRRFTWEAVNETQWYASLKHRLKFTAQARLDGSSDLPAANRAGSFSFLSLEDLLASRPSSFSRTLASPERHASVWNGALSLGDFWTTTETIRINWGARVEATRFASAPSYNPEVERIFGVRTDASPTYARLSPRFGFNWRYTKKATGAGFMFSPLGEFAMRPAGYVRGGFGAFRNVVSPSLLTEPMVATGRAGELQQLFCIGSAVPTPDWAAYAADRDAIPSQCAGGAPSLADNSRRVSVVSPGYEAPVAWRGNLAWSHQRRWGLLTADGVISFNRHQPGTTELNLRAPAGALASEGGRVLYAPTSAIVSSSGLFAPGVARRDAQYGRVTNVVSDLASRSTQLIFSALPTTPRLSRLSVSYTLGWMRAEQRGFDGAAFGELDRREIARGDFDVRHQIQLSAGKSFRHLHASTVTLFAQFRSGMPYTPTVLGDVNGDGSANDRAFIQSPAAASAAGDQELARDMSALLASAPGRARECLQRQLGSAAARNGCEGPWTATMNARIDLGPGFIKLGPNGMGRRLKVGLNLANPLGGIDQLLHGSNLHGWGGGAFPDPVLYTVTGFDPATQRFRYRVNPRFGSTSPSRGIMRAPFRATIDVTMDLSRPTEVQQLKRFLAPGRTHAGTKLDSAALKMRYAGNVPNIYEVVIRDADSLFLTSEQLRVLQDERKTYEARMDSIWSSLAHDFAALPDQFDAAESLARQEAAIDAGWEITRQAAVRIKAMLTPVQYRLSNWVVTSLAEVKGKVMIRMYQF